MPGVKGNYVLFLTSWYPKPNNPSLGIFVKRHAEAASKYQNCVILHVYSSGYNKTETTILSNTLTEILIYYKKTNWAILNLYNYILAYLKGYKLILESNGKPSLVQVNIAFPAGIIALIYNFLYNVPFVVLEHWSGYMKEDGSYAHSNFIKKNLTKLIIKKAKSVATVSNSLKEAMKECGLQHQNFTIIPNVIDTNIFNISTLTTQSGDKKRIIHISSLNDIEKNLTEIIQVVAELSNERNDFELVLFGTGVDKEKLVTIAKKLALLNKVIFFKGFLEPKKLANEIQQSAFLLLYSNFETFSCVVLEAMACGIPVLSANVGGVKELINNSNGILVPPKNPILLKEKINFLLNNPANYNKQNLFEFVQANYSADIVGNKLNNWYQQATTV